jgi:hypothetical protein
LTLLKSIVVCLVLANAGYFLWARGIAETAEGADPSKPAAVLKLASESTVSARTAPVATGDAADASDGGLSASPGPGASSGLSASSGGANLSPPDPGGGSSAGLLTNVKRCISVGPFRDVSEAAHAATTLRGGGYDPRQRVADGDVWAGVWVYLQLPPSRAAGDQILAKLKAGGIDDALEMPGPSDGSVISLGLYSEPKRAQARVAQAQALGFNPGIADRKRTGNVYWIDIDLKPTDSLLNPADLQGDAGRIVRLEVKGCPTVSGASS